ncbi:MAG TPA: peptidoglycan-associated lipoprotein Pal [Deltaproteobacteria bacterium]|nr:peptidoglycan-associated lipoprotein Pal [Deltaproteobacteria bacterium]HPR56258.1 peptidoglycan-associated lipoprotein Pal [Deltaproteobacteria bacterium]HXK48090.1 peptidoglycan-associated lipoprotein Pal [Deltaproteobacteria bacterium]
MRKTWLILVVLVIGFGFLAAGCAKKEPMEKAAETTPPQVTAQPAPAPEQPEEEMKPEAPVMPGPAVDRASFEEKDIHFDFDKFDLKPEDIGILDEKASFLEANPGIKIRIEGNCDERGTTAYNLALGDRRAKAAQDYLVEVGIEQDRISIISYGKERPLDPGHNEEAWAKNRRDHFVVLNK